MNHFVGNTDKSYLMAANGKITVVTSGVKKKCKILLGDCRDSITTVRTGFSSGNQYLYLFFGKKKEVL